MQQPHFSSRLTYCLTLCTFQLHHNAPNYILYHLSSFNCLQHAILLRKLYQQVWFHLTLIATNARLRHKNRNSDCTIFKEDFCADFTYNIIHNVLLFIKKALQIFSSDVYGRQYSLNLSGCVIRSITLRIQIVIYKIQHNSKLLDYL